MRLQIWSNPPQTSSSNYSKITAGKPLVKERNCYACASLLSGSQEQNPLNIFSGLLKSGLTKSKAAQQRGRVRCCSAVSAARPRAGLRFCKWNENMFSYQWHSYAASLLEPVRGRHWQMSNFSSFAEHVVWPGPVGYAALGEHGKIFPVRCY